MSSAEFAPLLPPTHPAVPVSARILSSLRNLTAPGKGNDLKPEERAALVGVSAVLACEKLQSKDLPEVSAQKACSVSPAHFRSTLLLARRLLANTEAAQQSSPSRRSSRQSNGVPGSHSSPPSISGPALASSSSAAAPGSAPVFDPLSPFQTPKKKYRYTSNIDVSDLMRSGSKSLAQRTPRHHEHEPTTGSPLKQSVTPSKSSIAKSHRALQSSRKAHLETEHGDEEAGTDTPMEDVLGETDDARTPTKKRKFHAAGVDLSSAAQDLSDADEPLVRHSTRRKETTSAFMALRPGVSPAQAILQQTVEDGLPAEEREYLARRREMARKRVRDEGRRAKLRGKRDWTYAEGVWGDRVSLDAGDVVWDNILQMIPVYMARQASPADQELGGPEELSVES